MLRKYNIARSSFYAILTLLGVAIVVFIFFHLVPSDPVSLLAGKHADQSQRDAIKHELKLDQPVLVKFGTFINDLSFISWHDGSASHPKWDIWFQIPVGTASAIVFKWPYLGQSYATGRSVSALLLDGLVETLVLVFAALLLAAAIGIPLGVMAAQRPDATLDMTIRGLSSAGLAVPSFVAAIVIAWLFGYVLSDVFSIPITGSLFEYDYYAGKEVVRWEALLLPALALSIRPMCLSGQLMRNSMIDVLNQDYIRTAIAKGLSPQTVLFKHALVNAINPVIAAFGGWFATLMAGSIFVEYIFGWKGLGSVLLRAIEFQDFPVIIGLTLVVSTTLILINWITNIILPNFDAPLRRK